MWFIGSKAYLNFPLWKSNKTHWRAIHTIQFKRIDSIGRPWPWQSNWRSNSLTTFYSQVTLQLMRLFKWDWTTKGISMRNFHLLSMDRSLEAIWIEGDIYLVFVRPDAGIWRLQIELPNRIDLQLRHNGFEPK